MRIKVSTFISDWMFIRATLLVRDSSLIEDRVLARVLLIGYLLEKKRL